LIELISLGALIGILSGFFGIGGGTILIPLLLVLGYETKVAIGMSIIQMLFSSIYGSYLNYKKGNLEFTIIMTIGSGGFIGAFFSGFLSSVLSDLVLESIFLFFVLFALIRMFYAAERENQKENINKITLFIIGFLIGLFSMTIGVGGSIMLVPILVGFFHIKLKKAIAAGLFFVVFSSLSGFISHYIHSDMDLKNGVIIGVASLVGVFVGVHLKDTVNVKLQKNLLVGFYLAIVIYLSQRIFF